MNARVLIVEDDPLLADGVAQVLRDSGFVTDYVGTAEQAEASLAAEAFDLLVLDIGLPGMDGLELLRRLRARNSPIHVLMLTARDALNERVRGLNLGADDYLTKPFASVELLARINALVRRSRGQGNLRREYGPLSLDEEAHRAWLGEQPLDLPQREWAILLYFLDNPARVLSKERIVAAVCTWDRDMSENAVEVYVSRLRAKLEPAGLRIRTVRGLGYMLEDPPA